MGELSPLIGSKFLVKRLWTMYTTRYSVSAPMQKSHYAIIENRNISNYPYIGCSIKWYAVASERYVKGDIVYFRAICPLRHFQPISLKKETYVTINEPEFNENHAYLKYMSTIHGGDIGRRIKITGGTTTWVDLGIHLVVFTTTLSQDTNGISLDYIRFMKPVFEFSAEFGTGESGVYMPFIVNSFSPIRLYDHIQDDRCKTKLSYDGGMTLGLSGGIKNFDITENNAINWITLDTIVELPDGSSGYHVLCVNIDITYKPEVYRQILTEPFSLENVEMGISCNDAGTVAPDSKHSRYVLYDAYSRTDTFCIYSTTQKTDVISIRVFVIPRYVANDYPMPDDMTNDSGKFLMRLYMKVQTSATIKDHVTFSSVRTETNLVEIEPSKLPYDLYWDRDTNILC